jgi:hypothetical protein
MRYAALALPFLGALVQGCSLFGDDCRAGELGECTSDTSQEVCMGGEGHFYWSEKACPAETTCRAIDGYEACFAGDAGASCATHRGCRYPLHCAAGTCAEPSAEARAACDTAPVVTVADEWAPFEVVLEPAPARFEGMATEGCAPLGGSDAPFRVEAGEDVGAFELRFDEPLPATLGRASIEAQPECAQPAEASVCATEENLVFAPWSTLILRVEHRPAAPTPVFLSARRRP